MTTPDLTFDEWLAIGITSGFCSPPVCNTHDLLPVTSAEDELWDDGGDPCLPAVRLWLADEQDGTTVP